MSWFGKKAVKAAARTIVRIVRARYDAAQTTPDNRKHWAMADGLSARAANSPMVRRKLRNNSRYEVANNSYARGIILTLANDTIGTGPRLQMTTSDPEVNRCVEQAFADWSMAVGLDAKLRTMRVAKAEDGESFGMLVNNSRLKTPVKLDIRLLEADQVATPDLLPYPLYAVDGIVFDKAWNPIEYHVLKQHPGDLYPMMVLDYDKIPVESMIHYMRVDRPGQARGVPEIMPALPLFAQLRSFTLAVISAAESAANIAVVMKTNLPADGEAADVEAMTEMDLSPNTAVFAPEGWEATQIKAEQPATTYEMFKHEILNEIARCLNMPYNIAACNSSGYNYASGRLDHQTYYKSIRVEQREIEASVLDRIFAAWLQEAVLVEGLLPQSMRMADTRADHQWFWVGHEHVDPAKEASAQETRLLNHTTTLAEEYARRGRDWEAEIRQRAKEIALMNELGLSVMTTPRTATPPGPDTEPVGAPAGGNEGAEDDA